MGLLSEEKRQGGQKEMPGEFFFSSVSDEIFRLNALREVQFNQPFWLGLPFKLVYTPLRLYEGKIAGSYFAIECKLFFFESSKHLRFKQ